MVSTPLKDIKVYESQLGWWNSQYMRKNKNRVPNHQPVKYIVIYIPTMVYKPTYNFSGHNLVGMLRIQDYPTNLTNSNQSSNRREIPPFFNPKVPSVYVHIPAFQANLRIWRIQHQKNLWSLFISMKIPMKIPIKKIDEWHPIASPPWHASSVAPRPCARCRSLRRRPRRHRRPSPTGRGGRNFSLLSYSDL